MLNGEQDYFFPLETSQRPLFDHLGSEDKRHRVREGVGHVFPMDWAVSEAGTWLDERLGPVRQTSGD